MEKKPKYEKMGLVRTSYEVFKGEGEIVLYCEHLHSVLYKKPENFKDKLFAAPAINCKPPDIAVAPSFGSKPKFA